MKHAKRQKSYHLKFLFIFYLIVNVFFVYFFLKAPESKALIYCFFL